MNYIFNEATFRSVFQVNSNSDEITNKLCLTHKPDNEFKLFPYNATSPKNAPIIFDLSEIIGELFKEIYNEEKGEITLELLLELVCEKLEVEDKNKDVLKTIIDTLYFKETLFAGNSLKMYSFQNTKTDSSAQKLSRFLFSILDFTKEDCERIKEIDENNNYLDLVIIEALNKIESKPYNDQEKYFVVRRDIQNQFKKDLDFMLNNGMTSEEDLADLLSLYYLFYMAETCQTLNKFFNGDRTDRTDLMEYYFALDWEKVGKDRQCCLQGWNSFQKKLENILTHALTLEILNHFDADKKMDYIEFHDYIKDNPSDDERIAEQIRIATDFYCSLVKDYEKFDEIEEEVFDTQTETAIRHLFKCIDAQFCAETERSRVKQNYESKVTRFLKKRWVKNRRKSGLVLNLKEKDIIFLTRICIGNEKEMRLIDLFDEYSKRGIYLDDQSKELLQEYYIKLNLIDKKSDSGDAQYVRKIL